MISSFVLNRSYSERAAAGGSSAAFRTRDDRDRRDEGGHRLKSDSSRGSHRDVPGSKGILKIFYLFLVSSIIILSFQF